MRADEDTLQQVRVVLATAMDKGLDPAETLHRHGLIFYPERLHEIRKTMLLAVAQVLDEMAPQQVGIVLHEREPLSPQDMKRQIVAWLQYTAEPPR